MNFSLLLLLQLFIQGKCFTVVSKSQTKKSFSLAVSTSQSSKSQELSGVQEFNAWFRKLGEKASLDSAVTHASFNALRGLAWNGNGLASSTYKIADIPAIAVLSEDFSQENWDRDLAVQLWNECILGSSSAISGYCSLLTSGEEWRNGGKDEAVPPSTAPDTLRHWTDDQKKILAKTMAGEKLISLEERQQQAWRRKYDSLGTSALSWPQFVWAMEAVHSRAFRGVQTSAAKSIIPVILAPAAAAVAGWWYTTKTLDASEPVLWALGIVAVIPTIISLVQKESSSAVMLPLIDSANHLESADSSIDFDPIQNCFQLRIGPKCLVKESSGDTQLYISYGPKQDAELLLNYGFLPGLIPSSADGDDEYRLKLAETFNNRN